MQDATRVLARLARCFEDLGIRYAVVGSFASSAFGEVRLTRDVDVVVDLTESLAHRLVEQISEWAYVDLDAVLMAVQTGDTFNIIDNELLIKADIYVAGADETASRELGRRLRRPLEPGPSPATVAFITPEDVVLSKLRWYRLGREVADSQWRDVLGVLKVRGGTLDMAYLRRYAHEAGVADLFERAVAEAGLGA